MKTQLLVIFFLFPFLHPAAAQNENNNWCFGYNTGLSFNSVPPHIITDSTFSTGATATISDVNGNLLFYSNGISVRDRNNNIMPNGDTLIPYTSGADFAYNTVIVPDPGSSSRYYIFAIHGTGIKAICDLRYSIVDANLNGGLGDVVQGKKNILADSNIGMYLAAAGNGTCDKWIVAHKFNSRVFHSFHITAAGISLPAASVIGDSIKDGYGEMKISENDTRLAFRTFNFLYTDSAANRIQVFDFDINTGLLSNLIPVDSNGTLNSNVVEMEFSPDGSKLYFANVYDNTASDIPIVQADISLPTAIAISNSLTTVGWLHVTADMQPAPDGKIYFVDHASPGITSLGVIDEPDKAGISCHVVNDYILYPFGSLYMLCNRVPGNQAVFSTNTYACTLPYRLSATLSSAAYQWSTGAADQAIRITQPGDYWVKTTQSCGAWRVDTFHVSYRPHVPVPDTFGCNGIAFVNIDTAGYHHWGDGTFGNIFTTTQSGNYTVATTLGSCVYKDTFHVSVYPPLSSAILPTDTIVCNGAMTADILTCYDLGNYLWSTGGTGRSINVNRPGNYWVQAVTPCGTYADTVNVSFCQPAIDNITTMLKTVCNGQCLLFTQLTHNYPKDYQWTFAGGVPDAFAGAAPPAVCYRSPGTYTIKLTVASAGGADSSTLQITVLPKPVAVFTDTAITIPYNTTLILPPCAAAASSQWYLKDSLVCSNCTNYTLDALYYLSAYKCVVSNGNCSDSCNYKINVTGIPHDVWLPTAFTPNGDGLNDYFHVITNNPNIEVFGLAVYDRWGACIFNGLGNNKWDGTSHGVPVQLGTYYWTLQYKVAGSNIVYHEKGDVTVVQ